MVRWLRVVLSALVVLVAIAGCARERICRSWPAPETVVVPPLVAGAYELWVHAGCGSRSRSEASGRLSLLSARADDRSPVTGETAFVAPFEKSPLYGFTDLDFGRVGAPMCPHDQQHPSPASRDPVRPGVLLELNDLRVIDPDAPSPPALLVGTLSNVRTHAAALALVGEIERTTDENCGIALWVESWDGGCYRGHWGPWGKRRDGSGTFRMCIAAHSTGRTATR